MPVAVLTILPETMFVLSYREPLQAPLIATPVIAEERIVFPEICVRLVSVKARGEPRLDEPEFPLISAPSRPAAAISPPYEFASRRLLATTMAEWILLSVRSTRIALPIVERTMLRLNSR